MSNFAICKRTYNQENEVFLSYIADIGDGDGCKHRRRADPQRPHQGLRGGFHRVRQHRQQEVSFGDKAVFHRHRRVAHIRAANYSRQWPLDVGAVG